VELDPVPDEDIAAGSQCELRCAAPAPLLAAHLVIGVPLDHPLPAMAMRLATTRGTNALLERRGAATALFITEGHADLLLIGTQQRQDLFSLEVATRRPLYETVVEVPERLAADGSVLRPLEKEPVRTRASSLLAAGLESAAVTLMHSYCNPTHERELAELLREVGFRHVSCSSELAPLIKLLPRAETAAVNAYLEPLVGDHLSQVADAVPTGNLHVMTSAGGLVAADELRACDALLSGPAGGVVGAALAARRSGIEKLIAFDMGGTSTDVSRWDGDFEYVFSHRVGDAHLVAPALAIESVAAGGGSICHVDGGRLKVGPESAGADPGPACYGAGGPLTLTDINLLLGRIAPERFEIPIDTVASHEVFDRLICGVDWGPSGEPSRHQVLEGFVRIANERMANAIRRISVRRGYDPTDYTLVAFGGAGPQHACAVASILGMRKVLIPPDASLLSAFGLGHALVERFAHRQVLSPVADLQDRVPALFAELAREAEQRLCGEGIPADQVAVRRRLAHLRLAGQESVLEVEWCPGYDLSEGFAARYLSIYGYEPPPRPLELESLRVIASTRPRATPVAEDPSSSSQATPVRVLAGGPGHRVPLYERDQLPAGAFLSGPALVLERHSATVVRSGWRLTVDGALALLLYRPEDDDAA
jgi:5-oxoprolinase (ATP-hydrolysing)